MGNKHSSGGKSRQDRKLEKKRQEILLKQQMAQQRERVKEEGKLAQADEFTRDVTMIKREQVPLSSLTRTTHFTLPVLRQLEELFNRISAAQTNDFLIDMEELTEAMGLRPNSLLARTLFRLFDITKSNSLNFRTWVLTLSALSTKATIDEKIRFSFGLYDLNGDGTIDLDELSGLLQAALSDSVADLSPDEVREICETTLKDADKDGNGTVDLQEYTSLCKQSQGFLEAFSIDIEKLCQTITRRSLSGGASQNNSTPTSRSPEAAGASMSSSSPGQSSHSRRPTLERGSTVERPLNVMSAKLVATRETQFREKKLLRHVPNQLAGAIAAANADGDLSLSVPIRNPPPRPISPVQDPSPRNPSPQPSTPLPAIDPVAEREMSYAAPQEGGSMSDSSHNLLMSLEALQKHLNPEALENAVRLMLGPGSPFTPAYAPSHPAVDQGGLGSPRMTDLQLGQPQISAHHPQVPTSPEKSASLCCGSRSPSNPSNGTVYPLSAPPSAPALSLTVDINVPSSSERLPKIANPIVFSTPGIQIKTPNYSSTEGVGGRRLSTGSEGDSGSASPIGWTTSIPPIPDATPRLNSSNGSIRDVFGSGVVEEEIVQVTTVDDLDELDVDHEDEIMAAKQRAALDEALSRGGAANNAVAELLRQTRDWGLNSSPATPARTLSTQHATPVTK